MQRLFTPLEPPSLTALSGLSTGAQWRSPVAYSESPERQTKLHGGIKCGCHSDNNAGVLEAILAQHIDSYGFQCMNKTDLMKYIHLCLYGEVG